MPILTSSIFKTSVFAHRYLGSVAFAFKNTMTTTLNHKTCIISSGQVLEKTPFAVNAIFTVKIEMVANRVFLKPCPEVFIQVLWLRVVVNVSSSRKTTDLKYLCFCRRLLQRTVANHRYLGSVSFTF